MSENKLECPWSGEQPTKKTKCFPPLKPRQLEGYLRIPFVDGGRGYQGCDCWGLVRLIYSHWSIELPTYGEIPAASLVTVRSQIASDKLHSLWSQVEIGVETTGDIVVMTGAMRTTDGRLRHAAVHVGLVVKPGILIHTEQDVGPMIVGFRGPTKRHEVAVRVKEIYRYTNEN